MNTVMVTDSKVAIKSINICCISSWTSFNISCLGEELHTLFSLNQIMTELRRKTFIHSDSELMRCLNKEANEKHLQRRSHRTFLMALAKLLLNEQNVRKEGGWSSEWSRHSSILLLNWTQDSWVRNHRVNHSAWHETTFDGCSGSCFPNST